MKHKIFQLPSKKEWMRQCITPWKGVPKARYTADQIDAVVAEYAQRGDEVQGYECRVCGWWHVGHAPSQAKAEKRQDQVTLLESGERVERCIAMENQGSQRERIAYIVKAGRAAERRANARPAEARAGRKLP